MRESLSHKTQEKSAFPFGQRQILNLYLAHYKPAFAFSLILYPPKSYAFLAVGLLTVFDHLLDSVGLTLLYRLVFSLG